jgi:hypothetical protein
MAIRDHGAAGAQHELRTIGAAAKADWQGRHGRHQAAIRDLEALAVALGIDRIREWRASRYAPYSGERGHVYEILAAAIVRDALKAGDRAAVRTARRLCKVIMREERTSLPAVRRWNAKIRAARAGVQIARSSRLPRRPVRRNTRRTVTRASRPTGSSGDPDPEPDVARSAAGGAL